MSTADYFNPRRYLEDETEILGRRLDTARDRLKKSRSKWSRNYWRQVIDQLTRQWRASSANNQGQALGPGNNRWTIDRDFIDTCSGLEPDPISRSLKRIMSAISQSGLSDSWERARNRQLTGGG